MKQKVAALLIAFALLASSLLSVAVAVGQSIAKPSVPEMTITLDNGAVRIQIRNQPYSTYNDSEDHVITLYYHIRMKDNYEDNWHYTTYPVPVPYRLPEYFPAVPSEYTTMDIPYSGNFIGFSNKEFTSPSGRVDFEVEALIGYSTAVIVGGNPIVTRPDDYGYAFTGESSGWSETQTVTIANPQHTPTPQPTVSPTSTAPFIAFNLDWQTVAIVGLVVAVVVLAVGLGVVWRRLASL